MYVVLANEVADVDPAEFEKVGSFHEGVVAVPLIDISLGLKGMRTSVVDQIEQCQNSLFVAYESPDDEQQLEIELKEDPFIPGILYRRLGRDYAELQYKTHLGALVVYTYFLVGTEDCSFAYQEMQEGKLWNMTRVNYANLWKIGLIREA